MPLPGTRPIQRFRQFLNRHQFLLLRRSWQRPVRPRLPPGHLEQSQVQNLSLQKPSIVQTRPVAVEQKPSVTPSSTSSAIPVNRGGTADSKTADAVAVQMTSTMGPGTMPAPSPGVTPTPTGAPQASMATDDDRRLVQPKSDDQPAESRVSPAATNSDPVTATTPEQSFALSAGNLAFAMQLSESTSQPEALASPEPETRPTGASTISATTLIAKSSATAAQPAPQIIQPPSGSESKAPAAVPDAPSHSAAAPEARDSGKSNSQQSINSAKPETTEHEQTPSDPSNPAPPATPAHSASTLYQSLTNSAAGLGATAHIDAGPAMNASDPPSPSLSPAAPPAQMQALNLAPPRTNLNNEILLNLGNGQTSAAVRVVDRAGTVTVSVHASDQDLRNSLRANLSDLTTQLSAQGLKTDVVKTASAQSSPESRQQQGNPEQRSSSQQHSSSQNDRQSQRERRGNNQWLEELAEQTSESTVQTGGNNS